MKYIDKTCEQFIDELASRAPTPGGGGASALTGAIGIALGMMVGNLTVGNPRYASVESDIQTLLAKAESLKKELLSLVDKDAAVFTPLARAYGIPKDDPSRQQVMEDALRNACTVPMEIIRLCARAIELCDGFAKKGAEQALSDAGIAVLCCKAAIQGAVLNILINVKYMDNRGYAKKICNEATELQDKYCNMADEIYFSVALRLR